MFFYFCLSRNFTIINRELMYISLFFDMVTVLTLVVQKVNDAIQRISIGKTNYAIRWIVLSDPLNNWGQYC